MHRRPPTAMGAALRSVLIPGWGQLATRRTRSGKILVFLSGLVAIAALTVFLFVEPIELAAWLANPDVILGIIVLNAGALTVRLSSTGLAWRDGGGHRWFAGIFLVVIVSVPHVAVGWVGLETRDSLLRLFPEESTIAEAASTTTTHQVVTSTSWSVTTTTSAPTTTTTLVPTTTTTKPPQPFGTDRLNILLLGGDAGPGRQGLRTDTMIVVSIDPVSGDAALIGVPRNYGDVTLSDGTPVPVERLNHVYAWGSDQTDRFEGPYPGVAAVTDVISNITGVQIDYFMLVDLTGFADLVDAFGGVDLNVPVAVDGPLYDVATGGYEMVTIPPGPQHLDGAHALAYARARHDSSDYVRMGRQRCILASMAAHANLVDLLGRLSKLLDVIEDNLVTDTPLDLVDDLIRLTPRVTAANTRMIGFDSTWGVGRTETGHVIPDIPRIREAVRTIIEDPASAADFGATTAEAGC